jgi:hypothetical protein
VASEKILPALANSTSDFGSVAENNNVCLVKEFIIIPYYNNDIIQYITIYRTFAYFCNNAATV